MNVTQVSLRATEAAERAGRPALTPELLAATGARYSRNNEGLDAILSKIDPNNLDKSVDGIFRMIDYGHQSIADMAPVAMFLDGVTMWLAYLLWSWCPTAGGQESSTRYIRMDADQLTPPEELGIADAETWRRQMSHAIEAYELALAYWEELGQREPERTRIPSSLLEDSSDKAQKAVKRMMRNYGFDRARCFLPVGLRTNVMLIMSARGWVGLCQRLLSHPSPEAVRLGEMVAAELELAAPRLLKHAAAKESFREGLLAEFEDARFLAQPPSPHLEEAGSTDYPDSTYLDVDLSRGIGGAELAQSLRGRDNRYAYMGQPLCRTAVRFGWDAVALAEIRDLNRHRTGTKYCPPVPMGFYWSEDELAGADPGPLANLKEIGRLLSATARQKLREGDPQAPYWCVLGTQFPFEHTTTADKFLYEAELRTGTGAHYRYANHLRDALALWYERFPETKGLVLEGSAEPE